MARGPKYRDEKLLAAFGGRLRQRREELGLTQASLAARAGITHGMVSYLECGSAGPSAMVLVALARALGVTTDYLLGLADEPARKSA